MAQGDLSRFFPEINVAGTLTKKETNNSAVLKTMISSTVRHGLCRFDVVFLLRRCVVLFVKMKLFHCCTVVCISSIPNATREQKPLSLAYCVVISQLPFADVRVWPLTIVTSGSVAVFFPCCCVHVIMLVFLQRCTVTGA